LIDVEQIRHEIKAGKSAWVPMLITAIGTVTIALEWAILLGIFSSAAIHKMLELRQKKKK
jgi:MFS superfamily sulfate permease-like transporter